MMEKPVSMQTNESFLSTKEHDSTHNKSSATVSKFDEVKPYLLYIEAILSGFVGDVKDTFPHAWKEGSINEFSYWTTCGVFTVRQAVSLLLNYYRYVIEEYFFCCRKNSTFSPEHDKICAKILKIISTVENAVWQHNDYDVNVGESNCSKSMMMDVDSGTETMVEHNDINSCSATAPSSKIEGNNGRDVLVESRLDNYAENSDVELIAESIDDEVERDFLKQITENGDAICRGDNNDVEMEQALCVILEDPVDTIDIGDTHDTPTVTSEINENMQNIAYNTSEIQPIPNKLVKKPTEIESFVDLVEQKWEKVAPQLSKSQQDMVRRSITHYHYMVSMESISAAQAFNGIEHLLNSLVSSM